jgi:hypothetical protein
MRYSTLRCPLCPSPRYGNNVNNCLRRKHPFNQPLMGANMPAAEAGPECIAIALQTQPRFQPRLTNGG